MTKKKKWWIAPGTPIDSLARADPTREPNKTIAVYSEGHNEANYFREFIKEIGAVGAEVSRMHGTPETLMRVAKTNKQNFDETWCVYDLGDNHPNIENVRFDANQNEIELAESNPSFEIWQLLHLEELPTRPMSSQEAKNAVRDRHYEEYTRESDVLPYSVVSGKHTQAIKRAKIMDKHHADHGGNANPSSGAWQLVESILQNGAKKRLR